MPTFKPFNKAAQPLEKKPAAQPEGEWQAWSFKTLQAESASPAVTKTPQKGSFKAQEELKQLREQARTEAYEKGYQEGFEKGSAEGYSAGKETAEKEVAQAFEERCQTTLSPLNNMLSELEGALQSIDEQLAESLVQLAVTVGRQLAGEALQTHPEEILTLVREIIHEDPFIKDRPTLLLHPEDAPIVQEHLNDELKTHGWRVRQDEKLERGGCRLVSSQGEIDATIEARWERIISQLRGRSEQHS
ncbi:flagellar assembly protein FliH [Pseudidiomarina homiensis]|uniref:flagellar assembly protein FliH n=1 Tax=Pseudidiomarina homiensis TaxID=364198 RepID=UPI00215B1430|nr:flagellar assembly protein FliH [Pseudidiomarina homiensis]